jgi:thiopurine S-methyltransferase
LLKYYSELVKGKRPRILLPLCSKSVDLLWLWRRGHEVVAIEDIGKSVIDFAKTSGLDLTADDDSNNNKNIPTIKNCITGENMLKALQTNFRTTNNPFRDHSFDTIWDRSGFASIPPHYRIFYAEAMKQLLIWDNFRYLLLVYEYEEDSIEGPPFSVTEDQIRELFSDIADVSRIHDKAMSFDSRFRANKFSQSGSDIREVIYLLQNK